MLGKADRQISFSDYWLEGRISEFSYWHKMRKWALDHIDEDTFQPLYSYYGRKSVPPLYTFMAMLIQIEKCYSDAEMEEASRFDDRVKYGMTAPRDFDGLDAVTLCDHRKRLFCSDVGKKIFIDIINKAKGEGMFSENNLHVIDSFMILGSCAKQDTYTMIYQGIKMVLKFMGFYGLEKEAKYELSRKDYDSNRKKPKIDWESNKEKEKLLDELVKDALALVKIAKSLNEMEADLKEAIDLLEKVTLQDIKFDEIGTAMMVEGTAKDRIISTNDPEMRHGRKTSSKRSEGYKGEIITGGDKGNLVVSIIVDGANVADGTHMPELIDQAAENGIKIDKLYGDCAYAKMEEMEKREDEMEFCVHIPKAMNANGCFTKDSFEIDFENGSVTCPNKNTAYFDVDKAKDHQKCTAEFDAEACGNCPHRDKCTKSKKGGRTVGIHPYEEKLQEEREYQKTDEFKKDYAQRSNGERTISQLTRHGGRKSKYKGKQKTLWQLMMVSISNNVKELMKFIINKRENGQSTGVLCLKAA